MNFFPFYKQPDAKDCGPTCLKILAKYYGKTITVQKLRELSETTRTGSSLLALSDTAEAIGFRTLGVKVSAQTLKEATLPCILHWNNEHYVVLYKIKKGIYYVSDPGHGLLEYTEREFIDAWIDKNATVTSQEGIALLIEPTPKFRDFESQIDNQTFGFNYLCKYVFKYKKEYLISSQKKLKLFFNDAVLILKLGS